MNTGSVRRQRNCTVVQMCVVKLITKQWTPTPFVQLSSQPNNESRCGNLFLGKGRELPPVTLLFRNPKKKSQSSILIGRCWAFPGNLTVAQIAIRRRFHKFPPLDFGPENFELSLHSFPVCTTFSDYHIKILHASLTPLCLLHGLHVRNIIISGKDYNL